MKTIKYYYSKPVHIRLLPVATNSQGDVEFVMSNTSQIVKTLPRVVVASVYNPKEKIMSFGVAVCSPKDVFKKSIGRKLAEDRARINPNVKVKIIKRGSIRSVSKRYANQLIAQHLDKDVQFDL